MRVRHVSITFFAALGLWPTASAGEPLQPLTPWNLDYGETQCLALRDFGSAKDPITFGIRPSPNGETYELLVVIKRSGPYFAEELEGSVDFGRGPIKAWLLHFAGKRSKTAIQQFRITSAEMAQARSATAVTLRLKGVRELSFALANMPALLAGLERCTVDLQSYWNMYGRENGTVAVRARGDVRRLFKSEDYPTEALTRFQQGGGRFLLLIDESGKVAGCHVLVASGVPVLDAMGCAVIRERARFTPARDRNGKPTRDSYVTPQINWRLQ